MPPISQPNAMYFFSTARAVSAADVSPTATAVTRILFAIFVMNFLPFVKISG